MNPAGDHSGAEDEPEQEDAAAEDPVINEPGAEEDGTEKEPAINEPGAEEDEPKQEDAVAEDPVINEPDAEEDGTEKEPAINKPGAEEDPAINKPGTEEDGAINKPGAEEDPAINKPGAEEDSAINKPSAEGDPAINKPGADEDGAINKPGVEEDPDINEPGANEDGTEEDPPIIEPAAEDPAIVEPAAEEDPAFWVQIMEGLHMIRFRLHRPSLYNIFVATRDRLYNIFMATEVRLYNFSVASLDCLYNIRFHLHNIRVEMKVRLYNFWVARLDRLYNIFMATRDRLYNIFVATRDRLYNIFVATRDRLYNIFVATRDRLYTLWVASLNRSDIWLRDTAFPAWRRVDWYLLNLLLLVLSVLICGRLFSGVQQGYLKRHRPHETLPPGTVLQQPFSGGNSFADGLYWCTTTLTTVGFGDITPKTDGAKIATSFLIILGITGMAMVSQTFNDGWSEVEDCLSKKWGWTTEPRGWPWLQDLFWDNLHWWIGEWEMILRRILAAVYSIVLLFVGVVLFSYYENKFFVDAFYAAVVAESTVGYGDFFFTTKAARICACFWLFLSTSACCRMLGLQAEHRLQRRAGRLLRQELTTAELATINIDANRERAYYELQMLKSGKFVQSEITWMRTHYIRISQPPGVQL